MEIVHEWFRAFHYNEQYNGEPLSEDKSKPFVNNWNLFKDVS